MPKGSCSNPNADIKGGIPKRGILLVTGNNGKFREAREIGLKYGVKVVQESTIEKFEIQASDVSKVAELAALAAYNRLKAPLIVDDTALHIDALKGFPGVYSSYVYTTIGLSGILRLMEGVENRGATFECAVSYYDGNLMKTFVGRLGGVIVTEVRGTGGFGYDPIFSPLARPGKTLGEVSLEEKNTYSHRAVALTSFFKWFTGDSEYT
ncbi:MAG: RdgB/HAM1 family non-canonical purine NTP pyrophosphatase [Candidatus Marsarchaeota archaeon]|nr:RdgB/HAM1 family non-canonical purine NTP pyrophosphatase [Candidatus Marsarchaeota archaeon]